MKYKTWLHFVQTSKNNITKSKMFTTAINGEFHLDFSVVVESAAETPTDEAKSPYESNSTISISSTAADKTGYTSAHMQNPGAVSRIYQ